MKILALETSCDETSAAIVEDGRKVLANVISSQADFHARYGGVIPEMAARQHLDMINHVIADALAQAGESLDTMDGFAATLGPGLVGSLLVGATAAKTLSFLTGKPFLGVNHLYAHVASNYLDSDLAPPFLCLLVSGGHTQLLKVSAYDDLELLGETLDDAVGEAYDKVARILGLPYPGGPVLDKLAQEGNPKAFSFPEARTQSPWQFSYSGLKTATLRCYEHQLASVEDRDQLVRDIAASFQDAATHALVRKTLAAAEAYGLHTVAVAGGVAANSAVRQKFDAAIQARGNDWRFYRPPMAYCTDNAAMVGASAYFNPWSRDWETEVFSRAPVTSTGG